MFSMKELSLRQIVQAIREGPLPKGYQDFYHFAHSDDFEFEIVAADAIGNASIVLSVDANELYEALTDIDRDVPFFGDAIEDWNDDIANYSLDEIADKAEQKFADYLDEVFQLRDHVIYIRTPRGYRREFYLGNDKK
jgi:hypothetical protein